MKVEAIIWDFGGVFTASPFEAFARYEAERGLPANLIRRVNTLNPDANAWALFERSEIDAAQFDAMFHAESGALGHPVRGAEILPLLTGAVRPRMVAALAECKRHFKVGCITNNMRSGHSPGGEAAQRAAGGVEVGAVLEMFDVVIESAKTGLRKPDPAIYLMMCEALAVDARACVYLDDLGINCKGAASVGMRAIKVTDPDAALHELEAATRLAFQAAVA